MAKQPITAAGVKAKQVELYALSDPLLAAQSAQVKSNFRDWIIENFTLEPSQVDFLGSQESLLNSVAVDAGNAIRFRLPIGLDYPPLPSVPWSSKYIAVDNNLEVTGDPANPTSVTGSINFGIVYVLQ